MSTEKRVMDWANNAGHHCPDDYALKHHALKIMSEVVELCIACNASLGDLLGVVHEEHSKAVEKGETKVQPYFDDPINHAAVAEEFADSYICMLLFRKFLFQYPEDAVKQKVDKLYNRQYVTTPEGVLLRKKGTPP